METLDPLLAKHPFFQGVEESFRKLLVGCASNVRFNEGEYLFKEGGVADKFFLIRHGSIAVEVYVPGQGAVVLQTVREGEVLGWSWLVPPYKWRFDARAMELTRAVALDGKCLRTKCEENPALGYEMLKRFSTVFAQRLQATRLQILDVYGQGPKK